MPCSRYKKQIEDAEEIAALNLAKFRKSQQQLEEAEERSRLAEGNLIRLRGNSVPDFSRNGAAERLMSPFNVRHPSTSLRSLIHQLSFLSFSFKRQKTDPPPP